MTTRTTTKKLHQVLVRHIAASLTASIDLRDSIESMESIESMGSMESIEPIESINQ